MRGMIGEWIMTLEEALKEIERLNLIIEDQ